jgi:hypothetical protein
MNRAKVLSDHIRQSRRMPFEWGVSDSVIWLADGVALLTGVDHAAEFRGRYDSCAAGRRLLGKTLLAFVAERFDRLDHPVRAEDGDIGVVRQGRDLAFGVFVGAQLYFQTRAGIGIRPRSDAVKAFRVP